jgi:aryl-alcohol dehydrogenase-like predicted oxidoreductase
MVVSDRIYLGQSKIQVSRVGLGTMQWKKGFINRMRVHGQENLPLKIYESSIERGVNFFDTAEIYGLGQSEVSLGECYRQHSENIVLASKFFPFPWRLSKGELRKALYGTLHRLGIDKIDLYQIHWPFPPVRISTWMDAMADLVADCLIQAVGVSNYSNSQTIKAYEYLSKYKIPLASNQIKYSLLDKQPERNGLLHTCKELGITVIAYSPLESGILTGKYTPDNSPPDFRSWRYNRKYLKKIEPLLIELKTIGTKYGGKTQGQVSLNWLVSKGIMPIPGAKSVIQAVENAGALGWSLTQADINSLDLLSNSIK